MNTTFLLMARYEGLAVIPVDVVCRDFFCQFTPTKFIEKVRSGEIKLPLVRLGPGQKAAKGIPLNDLAAFIDAEIAVARKDLAQMA